MQLVKRVTSALTEFSGLSLTESQIKNRTNQPMRDYGTMNNTLRRLCRHGVLRRTVGISSSTGIPSWHYKINMNSDAIQDYIKRQEAKMQKHRPKNYYFFSTNYEVGTASYNGPLMIGLGMAPEDKQLRCLAVAPGYELVTEEYCGNTLISFRKK